MKIAGLDIELPPEYPKPLFVVADNMVEAYREAFGDSADVIPISETMLATEADAALKAACEGES